MKKYSILFIILFTFSGCLHSKNPEQKMLDCICCCFNKHKKNEINLSNTIKSKDNQKTSTPSPERSNIISVISQTPKDNIPVNSTKIVNNKVSAHLFTLSRNQFELIQITTKKEIAKNENNNTDNNLKINLSLPIERSITSTPYEK